MGVSALALGCGPAGPSSLEGFGELGESESVGDGDGDEPGDGDGDDPGDGDGDDPQACLPDAQIGSVPEFFFEEFLEAGDGDDFPNVCSGFAIADYAIEWVAPVTGSYYANIYADAWLSVLRGTGCEAPVEDCTAFGEGMTFEALAGETYTFVVDGEFEDIFVIEVFLLDDMPGVCPDSFLAGSSDTAFGSTVGGGDEFSSLCGGDVAPDRSYLYVPDLSGTYLINTFGSSYDTMLHVFAGECGGPLVDCNDDANETLASEVLVELQAGQVYTIVVDGFGGEQGDYQLNLEFVDGPQDLCGDVDVLPSEVPVEAIWSIEEPQTNLFLACSFLPFERRLLWVAPADGSYLATLAAGETPLALAAALDGCPGGESLCTVGDSPQQLQFDAVAGQQIVFVGEWEPVGPDLLTLTVDAAGPNFCGEELGVGVPLMSAGSTLDAGNDHQGGCGVNPAPEVELQWTAPAAGLYRFSLEGSGYDTLMYIRGGGCDGPELGCNDDTQTNMGLQLWSSLELELAAEQTVTIFVDGYDGGGDYALAITQL